MMMIDTAVILAAGQGARMGAAGHVSPKGFIRLGDLPIVEESLVKLSDAGIRRVIIVTGHLGERYGQLRDRYPDLIVAIENQRYAESGSMYSLWLARGMLDAGFLLLDSDIVYERRALDAVLADAAPDVVLVSGPTGLGDEIHVEATLEGALVAVSKDRSRLSGSVIGEMVGITKLSMSGLAAMVDHAEGVFRETLALEYENALVAAARAVRIQCHLVPDLHWAEIDDEGQLVQAQERIYPRILASEVVN